MKKLFFILTPFLLFAFNLKAQADNTAARQKYQEALEQSDSSRQYFTWGLIILASVGLLRIVAYFYLKGKKK